jgi:magnesium chelatase subunit H
MHFLFLTMDGNHAAALRTATQLLHQRHGINLDYTLYTVNDLHSDESWARLASNAQKADFIFGSMLFGEELVRPLQGILAEITTPTCIITSNPALIRCTRIGELSLAKKEEDDNPSMLKRWMKKFRPKHGRSEGKRQLAMMRNLGKIMKFIPGKAKDLHTYISVHDYWMQSSPENIYRMLALIVERYIPQILDSLPIMEPIHYPELGIYHPDADAPFDSVKAYHAWRRTQGLPVGQDGAVGILSLRSVILSGNTDHLDALIRQLDTQGIEARTSYAAGLDFRPAMDTFYTAANGKADVDLLLNGAGFSLVGGMAESRPQEAREALETLNIGYLSLIPLSFQRVESWRTDDTGLNPMQLAMNIAIPELDGCTDPLVYGGPTTTGERFAPLLDQIDFTVQRVIRRVRLNRRSNTQKRIAVILFNFPPTLGNIGTAAYLDVFTSVYHLLQDMHAKGYDVEVPASPDALRSAVVEGNAHIYGTDGNVATTLSLDEYRTLFPSYERIIPMWGEAPGELLTNGREFYILGLQLGNVFIGIQPSFGYERDPMRMLMTKDASPHHGFAAFYTWLEHVFDADAVLHFGTHGAMEFMPGKQAGMSAADWPLELIGSIPNFYYYSVNNPSEATIAKRRGLSTLVSYMVPPLQQAGLYKGLRLLKDTIDNYHDRPSSELLQDIQTQAARLDIAPENAPTPQTNPEGYIAALNNELIQVEHRMIPLGLHVLGQPPENAQLIDILALVAAFTRVPLHNGDTLTPLPHWIAQGLGWDYDTIRHTTATDPVSQKCWEFLNDTTREAIGYFMNTPDYDAVDTYLHQTANVPLGKLTPLWLYLSGLLAKMLDEQETHGLLSALDGGYIAPSPGNDVVRNAAVVPTGRNIHGLDPFRVPTPAAQDAAAQLVHEMLESLSAASGLPETIAMILWGTDNLKSDGEGVAQVLSLIGARVVQDEMGNVADVELIPLAEHRRQRIDVVITVSGIFRDLLHHQMHLLDKAVHLAAEADEPLEMNFIRKHTLAHAADLNVSINEAATRVFSNAPGDYGANVNYLVESSQWEDDGELGETFVASKSYAFGQRGEWHNARAIMEKSLATVGATFQNIDSFEIGISDVDHYYEYLGGVTKSVEKATGERPPVLLADALSLNGRLSSLAEMVRLESRAKMLNPKWYEAMLEHGYEGVSEIETRVSNTYGWSATADAVEGWVYTDVAETFLLDDEMRARLTAANPHATAGITRRLLEAESRGYWDTDDAMIDSLREIYANLEDRMEGVTA